jgi:HIV Tat-specific factor 1
MSGRYFAGQKVEAAIYDGHTKYESKKSKEELEAEEKRRLERYAKWLETEEENNKTDTSGVEEENTERTIAADAPTP